MRDPVLISEQPDVIASMKEPLREVVSQLIEDYFLVLDGQPAEKLYELVMKEVELGLFRTVLRRTNGNQSKAAQWLGLARGTLRKRLSELGLE